MSELPLHSLADPSAVAPSPGSLDNGAPQAVPTGDTRAEADFPEPGTEAWAGMNRRRAELIRKKNRGGIAPDEQAEYERLQRLTQVALERTFPAPTVGDEALARIEARLAATPGATAE